MFGGMNGPYRSNLFLIEATKKGPMLWSGPFYGMVEREQAGVVAALGCVICPAPAGQIESQHTGGYLGFPNRLSPACK